MASFLFYTFRKFVPSVLPLRGGEGLTTMEEIMSQKDRITQAIQHLYQQIDRHPGMKEAYLHQIAGLRIAQHSAN